MPYDEYPEDRGFRYLVGFVYSIVVAVFWIPALVTRRIFRFFHESGTEGWPLAEGTIPSGDVKVIHGWILDYALGRLDYCYKVHDEYYSGRYVRQFADEQAAWDFVDSRRNKPALIRYKDGNAVASIFKELDQMAFSAEGLAMSIGTQVWQHWSDQLRGEPEEHAIEPDELEIGMDQDSTSEADETHAAEVKASQAK